jgi:hypothetical protein
VAPICGCFRSSGEDLCGADVAGWLDATVPPVAFSPIERNQDVFALERCRLRDLEVLVWINLFVMSLCLTIALILFFAGSGAGFDRRVDPTQE